MIYLYGLLEDGDAPDPVMLADLTGVTGVVKAQQLGTGWLIYSEALDTEILPRRKTLLAHTRVLEAMLGTRAVLPMRFGMFSEGPEAVADLVSAQAAAVQGEFDLIRGRVELGVRVSFPREPALAATLADEPRLAAEHQRLSALTRPPHLEVAEFGRVLAELLDRRRGQVQKRLLAEMLPHLERHVLRTPESDVTVLSIDALVSQEAHADFAERIADAAERHRAFANGAEATVKIVGPVPPFNFVRLNLGDAAPVEA